MTWITTVEHSSKWDAMASDSVSSRLKQPARPTTPTTTNMTTQLPTHDPTTGTTKTHDQRRRRTRRRYVSHPLSIHRQLDFHHPNAITASTLIQKEATGSLMTHSSGVKHISYPAQMRDHFTSSGKGSERDTLFYSFCIERVFFANRGGSTAQALWLSGQVSALCTGS